jgi:NitT/TauT family transport system substrate-binding protein
MKSRKLIWIALFAVVSAAVVLAAGGCGGDDDDGDGGTAEDLGSVVVQHVPADPSAIPLIVMKEMGLDEEHGFVAEPLEVDFDASTSVFVTGESDISVEQDIVNMSIDRNEGHEVVVWYPGLNYITGVLVAEDSPYESPEDLVGQKVGHYGIDSGGTTTIAQTYREFYDIDIFEEFDLRETGPGALPQLLADGEVEGIFLYEPISSRAILDVPARYLLEPARVWEEERGWAPWLTNLASREDWLQENPELAYAFRDAWDEALDMIEESDYEILRDDYLAEFLDLGSEEELDQFIEYSADLPLFARKWDQEEISQAEDYIKLLVENELLIDRVPEGAIAVTLEDYLGEQ